MAAGADGDSHILGPAAAERPARLNKSMGSPGLLILLTRLCRKPRPYGLARQGQSFLSSLGFLLFCLCGKNTPTGSLLVTGTPLCHRFFSKAQKSQASFSSGWFPVGSVATLSNMAAWQVPLMAGCVWGPSGVCTTPIMACNASDELMAKDALPSPGTAGPLTRGSVPSSTRSLEVQTHRHLGPEAAARAGLRSETWARVA